MKFKKILFTMFLVITLSSLLIACENNLNKELPVISSNTPEVFKPNTMELNSIEIIEDIDIKGIIDYTEAINTSDEEIKNKINEHLKNYKTYKHITEGKVNNSSIININYIGNINGVEFEGGSVDNCLLDISNSDFIKGFAEQCIGHSVGEEFNINVKFPEDYEGKYIDKDGSEKLLANSNAVFKVKINYIAGQAYTNYEQLDDLAAEDLTGGKHKTLDDLFLETRIEVSVEKADKIEHEMWVDLIKNIKFKEGKKEIVDKIIKDEYNYEMAYYKQMAKYYEVEFEQFIKENLSYSSMEEYEESIRYNSDYVIKQNIIIDYLSEKYNLTISDEEYIEDATKMAVDYGYQNLEEFETDYEKIEIYEFLQFDKVMELIREENDQM